jgi:hypothetical protein
MSGDITQLVRAALDAGVALQYVNGRVKAVGRRKLIEEWAPRLRPYRAELIEALRLPDPDRALAAAYHRHHFRCPACIAAGKGVGLRCGTGTALWAAYQNEGSP